MSEEVKNPEINETEAEINAAEQHSEVVSEEQHNEDPSFEFLQQQLEAAEAKANENWEMALREKAEADNIRRRAERDVENAHKYAIEKFAAELLPVLDGFDKGLEVPADSEQAKAMQEGMRMTKDMLEKTLEKFGMQKIEPLNEPFNPELHEAMAMQESADFEANHVMAVFQPGYVLNGRLVRPARVVVSRGGSPSIDTQA